jgi:hypothetical protein
MASQHVSNAYLINKSVDKDENPVTKTGYENKTQRPKDLGTGNE